MVSDASDDAAESPVVRRWRRCPYNRSRPGISEYFGVDGTLECEFRTAFSAFVFCGGTVECTVGDPLFEVLISEATPDQLDGLNLICGSVGDTGSEVTQEQRIEDAMQTGVVQLAVENDEEGKLLGGGDLIPQSEDAEQTVLEWLSHFQSTTN